MSDEGRRARVCLCLGRRRAVDRQPTTFARDDPTKMKSWDRLTSQGYFTGLPVAALPPISSLLASPLEEVVLSAFDLAWHIILQLGPDATV